MLLTIIYFIIIVILGVASLYFFGDAYVLIMFLFVVRGLLKVPKHYERGYKKSAFVIFFAAILYFTISILVALDMI
ncbi:hypothetical protein AN642_02565 [Epulopiscium sp. SCG-B10WGA-EpuloA2]|nr:hypothetical protein AN642_02565 [Epulopiscium sp. SCG-B10WGA-EpuloA2]